MTITVMIMSSSWPNCTCWPYRVSRHAHNLKAVGSNSSPATNLFTIYNSYSVSQTGSFFLRWGNGEIAKPSPKYIVRRRRLAAILQ